MATQPTPANAKTPAEVIAEKGMEFALGFDTDRIWATGVQSFVNPDFTMLVFREQTMAQKGDGSLEPMVKNVASIILPTQVVREFHALLTPVLANQKPENG
jgi:hypothetical protein